MNHTLFKQHDKYVASTFFSKSTNETSLSWEGNNPKTIRMFFELLSYYCSGRKEVKTYCSITSATTKVSNRWDISELIPNFDVFESYLNDPIIFMKNHPTYFEKTFGLEYMKPIRNFWNGKRSVWFTHGYGSFETPSSLLGKIKSIFFPSDGTLKGMELNFNFTQIQSVYYAPGLAFSFGIGSTKFVFYVTKEGAMMINIANTDQNPAMDE
jgi:hypothetical protein